MPARAKMVGLAAIDRAIKSIAGVATNLNERVQETAVAIVEHAAGAGNGDVSRALTLCQAVKRTRTLNASFLVGFFSAFAGTNVNLRGNDGKGTVNLYARDSKKQRGFQVDEARANNWFDAVDPATGERANWYQGPQPEDYVPEGIGDVADRFLRFTKRVNDDLGKTKTVKGKEVPVISLNDADKEQLHNALAFVERIAATLKRHEDVEQLKARLETATKEAGQDEEVLGVLEPKDQAVA